MNKVFQTHKFSSVILMIKISKIRTDYLIITEKICVYDPFRISYRKCIGDVRKHVQ